MWIVTAICCYLELQLDSWRKKDVHFGGFCIDLPIFRSKYSIKEHKCTFLMEVEFLLYISTRSQSHMDTKSGLGKKIYLIMNINWQDRYQLLDDAIFTNEKPQ